MTIIEDMQEAILKVPADSWTPAYDGDGQVREGAWLADTTGLLDLSSWPAGMQVIVRKERPHPGAQLRFTDLDGHRFTAFATDAKKGQLADLELRHRRRARCEDRIRTRRTPGCGTCRLKGFAQNQIWCEIVALASELLAWTRLLALTGAARRWEPKRLRLRLRLPNDDPGPARSSPPSPASRAFQSADQPQPTLRLGKTSPRAVEPRPPGATAGQQGTARPSKSVPAEHLRPRHPSHETSRLRLLLRLPEPRFFPAPKRFSAIWAIGMFRAQLGCRLSEKAGRPVSGTRV